LVADGVKTALSLTLDEDNGYMGSFDDLDKYNNVDGALIVYTIMEDAIADYSSVITGNVADGFTVTNTNDETTDIQVDKVWIGPAAAEAVVWLVADGVKTALSLTLDEDNGYMGSFDDLDKYNNVDGAMIVYTLEEVEIDGYTSVITRSEVGFIVTNTNDETVDIQVDKVWIGPAAAEAVVWLVADGVKTALSLTLDEDNGYMGSFDDLDKYNNVDGALIVYTIMEDAIADYSSVITGNVADGFTVTNTNDETIDVPVRKVWIGPAAEEAIVWLVADGVKTAQSLSLNEGNGFRGSFDDLDKYNNVDGAMIAYTLEEVEIDGYTSVITGNASDDFTVTNTNDETVDIQVDKVWVGPAATQATIRLVADGEATDLFLVLNAENGFEGSFDDLDKYNNVDGALIVYTITEDAIADYSTVISRGEDGFIVTNTNDETIDIPVTKVWVGPAAAQATIRLVADGEATELSLVLDAENEFAGSFDDLDKYNNVDGALIVYTITEDAIADYSSVITGSVEGFTVTNTNDELIDIPVIKIWSGPEAEQAVVRLVADGEATELSLVLDAENEFAGSFNNLDKYNNEDGGRIVYTITEDELTDYTTIITGDMDEGFTVTNTIKPKYGDLKIIKVDQFGNPVPGATFELSSTSDFAVKTDLGATDAAGFIIVSGLLEGTYYVREKTAPAGYVKSDEVKTVTISKELISEVTFVNVKDITLRIIKLDAATELPLAGAVFGIYTDEAGTDLVNDTEYTTDADGIIELALPAGTYYVIELTAPEGYVLDSTPIAITLSDNELEELILLNTADEEDPQTGTADYMYLLIGMILLLGAGVMLVLYKKEQTNR
ncbi:MAG: Cna B-type domain-containing protein, partial [Saccharofermentanales bacterium]